MSDAHDLRHLQRGGRGGVEMYAECLINGRPLADCDRRTYVCMYTQVQSGAYQIGEWRPEDSQPPQYQNLRIKLCRRGSLQTYVHMYVHSSKSGLSN